MKLKAFRCSCAPGEALPLDHYLTGACTDITHRDPDWMYAIQNILTGDTLHAAGQVTATRLTRCPRSVVISDFLPVSVDLADFNDVTWGTAMHEFLAARGRPGMHKEVAFPFEGQEAPVILGVPMRGRADLVTPDTVLIKDYKFHGAWAQWFAWQDAQNGEVKPELSAQFSIYKIALEKLLPGTRIAKALVTHAAMTGRGRMPFDAPPWLAVEVPFLTEEQIGALKPLGGDLTVLETLKMLLDFKARLDGMAPAERSVEAVEALVRAMIPMVGRTRGWKGKKGFTPECDYCSVRWDCERIEGVPSL